MEKVKNRYKWKILEEITTGHFIWQNMLPSKFSWEGPEQINAKKSMSSVKSHHSQLPEMRVLDISGRYLPSLAREIILSMANLSVWCNQKWCNFQVLEERIINPEFCVQQKYAPGMRWEPMTFSEDSMSICQQQTWGALWWTYLYPDRIHSNIQVLLPDPGFARRAC